MSQKPLTKPLVISLIDMVSLSFMLILVCILIITHNYNPYSHKLYALYGIILIFIFALASYRQDKKAPEFNIYFLFSSVLIFFILYGSISGLLPVFAGDLRYDQWIDDLDKRIFGISPTVFLQKMTFPLLTEILYILYAVYFFLPVLLIYLLYKKAEFKKVEISMYTLFINFYGAYIAYFIVPVKGPRYYLIKEHTKDLEGIFFSAPLRDFINFCEPSTLDCFPSLHASILVVITMLAFKHYKKLFLPFVILSILIIFSLVYLRYHYILDIVAGIIWAVVSVYFARYTFNKYSFRFNTLFVNN